MGFVICGLWFGNQPNPQSTTHNPQSTTHNPQSTTHNPQPTIHNPHPTTHKMKRISILIFVAAAVLFFGQGCATRKQQAVDQSMLIQENLQLDQALSIAQYELMLAQQENEELRRQLDQPNTNGSGSRSRNMPPLRSNYEPVTTPNFDANDSTLPQPTNQMPPRFQQQQNQQQMPSQSQMQRFGSSTSIMQASGVQYVEVPPDAPQWSPQRRY